MANQWDDFTDDQKKQLSDYTKLVRSLSGEEQRHMNNLNVQRDAWYGSINGIIAGKDLDTVIEDDSGLAGSAPLTINDLILRASSADTILVEHDTDPNRQLRTKAAGAENVI